MTELRVECVADRAELPDLGLSLRRGQVVWVPVDSVAKSACLRALQDIHAVSVVSAQRCSVMRNPPPPSFRLARKGTPRAQANALVPTAVQGGIPVEELDARIQQAVAGAVDKLADRLVAAIGHSRAAPVVASSPLDEGALSRAVADAVSQVLTQQGGSIKGAALRVTSGPEEPVYIPTGIVSSETATDLQVTAQAADAGDLAGAASALRKTRIRKTP
jgi:hypothetical protein